MNLEKCLFLAPTSIKENICGRCSKSINNEPETICSECHQEFHKSCLTRMVNSRPVKDWKCLQCLVKDVHEADFFFSDNDEYKTLRTFQNMANEFKAKHFGVSNYKVCIYHPPHGPSISVFQDIPVSKVEKEYWRQVGDFDCGLKVEYGADLLSSEISSGFPLRVSISDLNELTPQMAAEFI